MRAVVDPNVLISSRISDLGHPARIARAQGELRSNSALRNELLRRNIQLRNVIAIDEGRNGRWTVYMR